jgi:hypothetical protein
MGLLEVTPRYITAPKNARGWEGECVCCKWNGEPLQKVYYITSGSRIYTKVVGSNNSVYNSKKKKKKKIRMATKFLVILYYMRGNILFLTRMLIKFSSRDSG